MSLYVPNNALQPTLHSLRSHAAAERRSLGRRRTSVMRSTKEIVGVVAGASIVLGCLSPALAGGCDSGRSVRRVVGSQELVGRLRASAEKATNSPFLTRGTFDEEEMRYLGRTASPGSFDLVLLTTTWGEACRATRRLLVFDNSGIYLGSYAGLSEVPTRLAGNALLFPVQPQHGDQIEFSAPQPAPVVRLDGHLLSFESAAPRQP